MKPQKYPIFQRFLFKTLRIVKKNPALFSKLFNIYNQLFFRWKIRILPTKDKKYLEVREQFDDNRLIKITRPSRFLKYNAGICGRLGQLSHEYFLDNQSMEAGDVFFDIGANIGEVTLAALDIQPKLKVLAFEPDYTEFEALKENLPNDADCYSKALWSDNKTLNFYGDNETGDSSLFPSKNTLSSTSVETTTLDEIYKQKFPPNTPVRLLKIEAEGAEPEIIRGGQIAIQNTQTVVVDVGPERGLKQDNTLPEVCNLLFDDGFKIKGFNHSRFTVWFER